jgi:hypothetical protein
VDFSKNFQKTFEKTPFRLDSCQRAMLSFTYKRETRERQDNGTHH